MSYRPDIFVLASSVRPSTVKPVVEHVTNGVTIPNEMVVERDLTAVGYFESDDFEVPAMVASEQVPSVDWSEAVTFVTNTEEMPDKLYRIVMFIAGHDVEGPWMDYHAAVFQVECLRLARAGVGFSVEFK